MSERVIDVAARAAYQRWTRSVPTAGWFGEPDEVRMVFRSMVLAVAEVLDHNMLRDTNPSEILEREARSRPE